MSSELGLMEMTPPKSKQSRIRNQVEPKASSDPLQAAFSPQQDRLGYMMLEAAKNASPQQIEALLRDGVSPNVIDATGRSPLHLAVSSNCNCDVCVADAEACIILLLSSNGVDINLQDDRGNTALHLAAINHYGKCSQILISYGADVNLKNEEGKDPVQIMARTMPHSLIHLLNESVFVDHYDPHHEKCTVKVDLRPVTGGNISAATKLSKIGDKNGTERKMERIRPLSRPSSPASEISLLMKLLKKGSHSTEQILIHPVVQIFLHLKWQRVRPLFLSSLILYLCWVILYTSYVLHVYVFSCPCRIYRRTVHHATSPSKCEIETGFSLQLLLIIVPTIVLLLLEIGRFALTPLIYVRSWLNLTYWILIACVFATTVPNLREQTSISGIQYQLAAFTVLLAWACVLPQIGRLPMFSKYVEIFGHVVKCFATFLLTFLALYVGFALAFGILFFGDETSPFANFFHSSVKVFVMMVGELDYQDMFYGDNNNNANANDLNSQDGSEPEGLDPKDIAMGHLLFAAFVILVCIVLTNLFVGLTVNDVQRLERQAEFSRTCRLILEMFHLESAVFSKRVPSFLSSLIAKILLLNRESFSFRPNDKRDGSLPMPLSMSAFSLATSSFKKTRTGRCVRGEGGPGEPELVQIHSFLNAPEFAPQGEMNEKLHHPHKDPHDTSSSSSSDSESSTPLETNSLDLDVNQPHPLASFRPWASCMDHTSYK